MAQSRILDLQLFLDRLTSRSVLTFEERQAILALPFKARRVDANQDFVRQGELVDHACLVAAGLVGRFSQDIEGARQITAFYIPGDLPDLHSVVVPRATTGLQALFAATILQVPHSALRAIAAHYPAISEAFWRDCVVDAGILAEWVTNVGRRHARARIAHLICEMAYRLVATPIGDQSVFAWNITQAQLGDATGLSPVHVNRVLRGLRDMGAVEFRNRMVRVLNWEKLVAAGEFDPEYLQIDSSPEQRRETVRAV